MYPNLRVALVGFGEFEHRALGSVLRLSGSDRGRFEQVRDPAAADVIVVNADVPGAAEPLAARGRIGDAVFIGEQAPPSAAARLPRPIDALALLRELQSLARQRQVTQPAAPPPVAAASVPALLVDDSPIALRFLQLRLQQLGLACDLAPNSERALELLAQHDYPFVFIDVELGPGSSLDGLALCQHLRRQHHHHDGRAPVLVLVSAHASELDRARGAFAGCDHYLAKPAEETALRRLLVQPRALHLARAPVS